MTSGTSQGFRDIFFTAEDGLRLYGRDYPAAGAAAGRLALVCLPGLSRNGRDFHRFALAVSRHPTAARRVVTLDYRGRGGSAHDPDPAHYTVGIECRDVVTACTALGLARAVFVGTSRGGIILHVLAASRPDLVAASILNDIGPQIESAGLAEIRDYLDRGGPAANLEEAADALAAVHGAAFPALTRDDWLEMAEAIHAEHDGRLVPDFDPALLRQLHAIDYEKPLATLWPQFARLAEKPVLAIRGEHSRLLSPAALEKMAEGGARTVTAPGQGHPPLLHRPEVFAEIAAFLDDL